MASSLERPFEGLVSDEGCNEPGPGDDGNPCNPLLCEGKRLQALNLTITQRNADAMSRLSSRSDREARKVMTSLNEDLKKQNSALAAYISQLTSQNLNLREILKKSEDGRAAIDMQKAAEVLVKGLANAEEEVQGLKATLREVCDQRDRYRNRLARTNAELKSSSAHAQIMSATASASSASAGAGAAVGVGVAGSSAEASPVPIARRSSLGVQQLTSGGKAPRMPRAIPSQPGGGLSTANTSAPEDDASQGRGRSDRSERCASVLDLLGNAGTGGWETGGAGKRGGNPLEAVRRGESTMDMSDEGDGKGVGHNEGGDRMVVEGRRAQGDARGGADVAGHDTGYDSEEAPSMFF